MFGRNDRAPQTFPWYAAASTASGAYNVARAFIPNSISHAYNTARDTVGYFSQPYSRRELSNAAFTHVTPLVSRLAHLYESGVRNSPGHSYSPIYRYARALFTTAAATKALSWTASNAGRLYNNYNERAARIAGKYNQRMYYNRKMKLVYRRGYVGPRTARLSRVLRRGRKYRKRVYVNK